MTSSHANYYNNNMNVKDDIFFLIKHLSKCIELSLDKESAKLGLTPQQGRLLGFLIRREKENVKVRQIDIEERFQLSKSTVSGLVKRMESKNLIYKKKEKKDIFILPSDEGKEIMAIFIKKAEAIKQNMMSSLNEKERESTIENLNILLEALRKEDS